MMKYLLSFNQNTSRIYIIKSNPKSYLFLPKKCTDLRKKCTDLRKKCTDLRKKCTDLRKIKSSNHPILRYLFDLFTCTKYYKYYKVLKNIFTDEIFLPIENIFFRNLQIKKGLLQ